MPTKPIAPISTVGSQKDKRYFDTFTDQHRHSPRFPEGRPWTGSREFAANQGAVDGFVSAELQPGLYVASLQDGNGRPVQSEEDREESLASAWSAPWWPEPRYFEFNYARRKIQIRYDKMMADDQRGMREYYQAASRIASQNGWTEVEYGAPVRGSIVMIIGDAPRSPKIAQAAMAGDPWLLGFDEEPNPDLAKILGLTITSTSDFGGGLYAPRSSMAAKVEPAAVLAAPSPDALAQLIAQALAATLPAAIKGALAEERETQRRAQSDKIKAGMARTRESAA